MDRFLNGLPSSVEAILLVPLGGPFLMEMEKL